MRKNPRRILSPQRLPFRHPGAGFTNLTNRSAHCNTAAVSIVLGAEVLRAACQGNYPFHFDGSRYRHKTKRDVFIDPNPGD
jgi:hypothetical protein